MRSVTSGSRLVASLKGSLRDLNIQLSLFNRQIGAHIDLRDSDFDCLEVLSRHGPLTHRASWRSVLVSTRRP